MVLGHAENGVNVMLEQARKQEPVIPQIQQLVSHQLQKLRTALLLALNLGIAIHGLSVLIILKQELAQMLMHAEQQQINQQKLNLVFLLAVLTEYKIKMKQE
jgi:hypothetical protein